MKSEKFIVGEEMNVNKIFFACHSCMMCSLVHYENVDWRQAMKCRASGKKSEQEEEEIKHENRNDRTIYQLPVSALLSRTFYF
jgi:hypothetical protein